MIRFKIFIFFYAILISFSEIAFALQAITVKGNRVLLSLDSSEQNLSANTVVVSTDKSAQIKILQVRGSKALGQIVKGSVKSNMIFRAATRSAKKRNANYSLGFLAGVSLNTMTIQLNSATLELKGTGFNVMGLVDYPMSDDFNLRGLVGYESFNASVASSTCASGTCSVKLNYLSAEGYGQYNLINFSGGSTFWLGLGAGALMSMSASSEIINVDSMKTNQIFILATGLDFQLSTTTSIPVQVDYFIYPDGDIKTQQINLRAGYKF